MITITNDQLKRSLIFAGVLFTIIIFLWPITMVLATTPNGPIIEQLNYISQNHFIYKLSFIVASFISPSILLLMVLYALFIKTDKETLLLNLIGVIFLLPYLVFVTISYTSQYTIFIHLLQEKSISAENWYFGNFDSISYYFNQLGYLFFGIAGICIGYRFCFDKGIKRIFGLILEICSILSVIAFIGLVQKNEVLNFTTLISGLLTLPMGIISIIIGKRVK